MIPEPSLKSNLTLKHCISTTLFTFDSNDFAKKFILGSEAVQITGDKEEHDFHCVSRLISIRQNPKEQYESSVHA